MIFTPQAPQTRSAYIGIISYQFPYAAIHPLPQMPSHSSTEKEKNRTM